MLKRSIAQIIATELSVQEKQVIAAIELLDEGATVPFIARYRKEVTNGLDDTQLRDLQDRLIYLRELEERRQVIIKSISDQDKLTPELEKQIHAAATKTILEDLYLPYKQKRRTKATIAKEAGLEPLALSLLEDPSQDPETLAKQFFNEEQKITDTKAALDGAKYILIEQFSEQAALLDELREFLWENGIIETKVIEGKQQQGDKFSDYFDYQEKISKIPSHRALAIFRGRKEGVLLLSLTLPESEQDTPELVIAKHNKVKDQGRAADKWLQDVVNWAWRTKVSIHLELQLVTKLREMAEEEAIKVFSNNLQDLLLAAPAGHHVTIGLDPGLRTGVKVVVVDATGKLLAHSTIFPHAPQKKWDQSLAELAVLADKYRATLVSIGNGTASRETDKLVIELMKKYPSLNLQKIVVSEAGASVYSASKLAAQEFPDLDVSFRGAVSIARRLQDPLAELVKIEAKAIGVGQYQHDVNQTRLARKLDSVVQDCVNAVGVELNTASVPLLKQVSGLNETIAQNIIAYRNDNGMFKNRNELKKVARLGEKTFEQAAGFLRIVNGSDPLDASAVHPEAYPVVKNILQKNTKNIKDVLGNNKFIKTLKARDYTDEKFGIPTVTDILVELEKPGRDPRPEFKTAEFKEGVEQISDLKPEMILEGVITNVTNFGAFVDIGVHQDGLVHISAMSNSFITDPRSIVKAGDVVTVKVMEVDAQRKRVGLSMRLDDKPGQKSEGQRPERQKQQYTKKPKTSSTTMQQKKPAMNTAMADAFAKLKK